MNLTNKKDHKKQINTKLLFLGCFWVICILLIGILLLHQNPLADQDTERLKKICGILLISVSGILATVYSERLILLPKELWSSRKLIWKLAKNDFKKRYAGSYLGIVWALAQPIVTVLMYWIVFDKVFRSRSQLIAAGVEVPYVVYLTAGLVPWFYFSEALMQGTMALLEYDYLVKKVVFNISILPIIKIIGATFNHLFFVGILLLVSMAYGIFPTIYTLQILYYSFCLFMLVLAMSYLTCAVVVFFRDLQQIIAIVLQIGMWATPILWDLGMIRWIYQVWFKLNPITYIVNGFRSAIYGREWFWQHFYSSTYFWILVMGMFCVGSLVFRKLKVHFADVM